MAENSAIEWTDHTFNPWLGCTKVSPACDHCYAEARMNKRLHIVQWGPHAERKRTSKSNWKDPVKWNKQAQADGRRFKVFCASLADVFDNAVPADWRLELFELIRATPHLDWLLLTKRIGNAGQMIADTVSQMDIGYAPPFAAWPWPNVWLGATICNQAEADRDIPKLLATDARVRFLSIEPILGPIDLESACDIAEEAMCAQREWREMGDPDRCLAAYRHGSVAMLDWVICGGESGPQARPMHPDWARSLRDQCQAAGVPLLFKQWGEWAPRGPESMGYPLVDNVPRVRLTDAGHNGQQLGAKGGNDCWMQRAGKKATGRLLDGIEHNEFPRVSP